MIIRSFIQDESGRSGLEAKPEEYDAWPPLQHFLIDGPFPSRSSDRIAVAAALLFGQHVSGRLEFEDDVSADTAEAIQRFLHPTWISVTPLVFSPRASPMGNGTLRVAKDRTAPAPSNVWGERRDSLLVVHRSDHYAGHLRLTATLEVASNAWLFGRMHKKLAMSWLPYVASAVLFAESMHADRVAVPSGTGVWELPGLADLVASSGLACDEVSP